jgi:D-3-phosphoglycerate dehydrogenase / 2-oxoglutarate reductase
VNTPLSTAEPATVLLVQPDLELERFQRALAPALHCTRDREPDASHSVVALITAEVPVTSAQAERYPNLRVVATCSTGTEHIDVRGLAMRGVAVCNAPTYCAEEVADHALAFLLGAWRELWTLDRGVRSGEWDPGLILRRFDAQRLGIVGLGRIGRALARRARALGVEVVAHDPWAKTTDGVRLLALDELLATVDAVAVHAPASPGEPPLIAAAELATMKRGAVLINLARASLVDIDAVCAALRDGGLSAAAFDVWDTEPPLPDDERLSAPGLLLTPHVGWSSARAVDAVYEQTIDALRAVLLEKREPAGRVT